jgi:hypothetical protein
MKVRTVRAVLWLSIIFALSSGPLLLYIGLMPNRAIEPCYLEGSEKLDKDMKLFSIDRQGVLTEAVKISDSLLVNVAGKIEELKAIKMVTANDRLEYEETLDAVKEIIDAQAEIQERRLDALIDRSLVWVQIRKGCWSLTKGG